MVALPKQDDEAQTPAKINTHGMICDFGKHRGTPYTRLPVSYLNWMINEKHSRSDIARAELERRQSHTPDMDISGHAIDRASTSCRDIWDETRGTGEGLHSWLCKVAKKALEAAETTPEVIDEQGRIHHAGMIFVFDRESEWPVLKTLFPQKRNTGVDWPAPVRRSLDRQNQSDRNFQKSKGNW